MYFSNTDPPLKFIYKTWAHQEVLAPANTHGPAEVMQRCEPEWSDLCLTPTNLPSTPHPSILLPYKARTDLQTREISDDADTKTLGMHRERGSHMYTRFFSPSLISYSCTGVLGYRSLGKAAFVVSVATDCCFQPMESQSLW